MIRTRYIAAGAVIALILAGGAQAESASASGIHFANCTAMHHTYKHGVGRSGARDHVRGSTKPVTDFYVSTTIYDANKSLDRDHDGVACEAH
jgi:hypothetical protein